MQTKQDYAYQLLKDAIINGTLLPGKRIVANRFAQEIGISAIPVREALLRLEAEGLVHITPHIGAVVTLITGKTIQRTLETLALAEGYATRLAAPHAEAVIEGLKRHNLAMDAAIRREDWETFSAENRHFHTLICSVVDNSVLIKTITDLWNQLDTYLSTAAFYLMPDRASPSVEEHAEIIALLSAADPDLTALEMLARQHKLNTARRLQALGDRDAKPQPLAAIDTSRSP